MIATALRTLVAAALAALAALPAAAHAQSTDSSAASARNGSATGTLVGWVTDDSTCMPVGGARVSVDGRREDVTDSAGRFAVGGLAAGAHAVRVERTGYEPAEQTGVDVPTGALNDVGLELRRPGRAVGGAAGAQAETLHLDSLGAVVDPPHGVAAPGRITWTPRSARQGGLIAITVDDTSARWTGELAGEPLHFRRAGGVQRALAGVPIGAADTVVLSLRTADPGATARPLRVVVPVARGEYRVERLTVAPRFGTPPDSTLAERLARESMLARRVSCRSHHRQQLWRAPFVRPRPGRVTSPFGGGREFNGVVQSRHMGTDLAGQPGAPIRAMNRGVVALVGDFYLGGRVVYVDHGAGLTSAYLHMSRQLVAEGDTVDAGQVIGRVGATGRVTGPHLHWIVRYGGVTVDPMSVFTAVQTK